MREIKTYQPHQRRDIEHNLYCPYCGNTMQWQMDIRLIHTLTMSGEGYVVEAEQAKTERLLSATSMHLGRMLDLSKDQPRPVFRCANCGNAELDRYGIMIETCYNLGCPGCFHCGNWIDEDDLRDMCQACIKDNDGDIDEDYCFSMCPHYDFGLEDVRQHYAITLEELIRDAGYGDDR